MNHQTAAAEPAAAAAVAVPEVVAAPALGGPERPGGRRAAL
ncbi:EamA family transporter, partial [Streptomyces sp. SID7909]|nr:EamA family transporter [Streptomyces sp. SID7909]